MAAVSDWRAVWIVVMFDLPVKTKLDKTRYRYFHDFLLDDGFLRLQYSVYGRHCISRESADTHMRRVRSETPPRGEVRMFSITEAQFGRMEIFRNFAAVKPEPAPQQLEFW